MSAYDRVTDALRDAGMKVRESSGGARSQCPAHGSRGDSLAVRPNPKNPDGPLHVTCFAGCDAEDVLAAIGLALRDLYDENGSRTWTPPRPRRQPSPWDLIPDPEHLCDRIIQQEVLDGATVDPLAALDRAWSAHRAANTSRGEVIPPDVFADPARQSAFTEWIGERLTEDPTLAPPVGRVVLHGSTGRNRVFDIGDPGYHLAVGLAVES